MSQAPPWLEIALPPGTEEVLGVYVNGIERQAGVDYDVLPDRVQFRAPLNRPQQVTGFGKLLLGIGVGIYPKGDVIDLSIRRRGKSEVIRGRAPTS